MSHQSRDGLGSVLTELDVAAVVQAERHARDRGAWDEMAAAYHPQSWIRFAWFEGTGAQLVEASRSGPPVGNTKHRLSPTQVQVRSDRAVAETSVVVETRTRLDDIAVDLSVSCRWLSLLGRHDGRWLIQSVETLCEKDQLRPVDPNGVLALDPHRLADFRSSYQFLSQVLAGQGRTPPADLPGDDMPETTVPLYRRAEEWLKGREAAQLIGAVTEPEPQTPATFATITDA